MKATVGILLVYQVDFKAKSCAGSKVVYYNDKKCNSPKRYSKCICT